MNYLTPFITVSFNPRPYQVDIINNFQALSIDDDQPTVTRPFIEPLHRGSGYNFYDTFFTDSYGIRYYILIHVYKSVKVDLI